MKINHTEAHRRRHAQVMEWYAPARFGLFCHWGMFTGGGSTCPKYYKPLTHPTVADLERAAPDPTAVGQRLAATARRVGARYVTLTLLHSEDGHCVIYPTQVSGFAQRTRLDYFGEFVRACSAQGIKPLAYMPAGPDHWDSPGGPWLDDGHRDPATFSRMLAALIDELAELHGDRLAGFWIDGMNPDATWLPSHMRSRFPKGIVINNNNTSLDLLDVDYGTTEFLATEPRPPYCRPSALREVGPYTITPPGHDFNEDIPTCNDWWDRGEPGEKAAPYLADPNFLVRQMISSLGQRGQWNFALGIGPTVEGKIPEAFEPSFQRLAELMSWGSEAIHGTTGGEGSRVDPGCCAAPWSPGGFCSVTVSLAKPNVHHVLVTTAPACPDVAFRCGGRVPERIVDLRSGEGLPFEPGENLLLRNVDWSDVERYGAKVFKVTF